MLNKEKSNADLVKRWLNDPERPELVEQIEKLAGHRGGENSREKSGGNTVPPNRYTDVSQATRTKPAGNKH